MRPRHLLLIACVSTLAAVAQQAPGTLPGTAPAAGYRLISPIAEPTYSPGVILLIQLETKFAEDTAKGGGKSFSTWFAEDAVTLSNGKPALLGRGAIAAQAGWNPKDYSLTWSTQGARMGPSNDMGFTWGHYVGRSTNPDGAPTVTQGRYITIWEKLPDGSWKVALDASAEDSADPVSCCALPQPGVPASQPADGSSMPLSHHPATQ